MLILKVFLRSGAQEGLKNKEFLNHNKRRHVRQTIDCKGKKIALDDEGYLLNLNDWNEDVACTLAEREDVEELTKDKMDIIKFMREYYKEHKFSPILRAVCKNVH